MDGLPNLANAMTQTSAMYVDCEESDHSEDQFDGQCDVGGGRYEHEESQSVESLQQQDSCHHQEAAIVNSGL